MSTRVRTPLWRLPCVLAATVLLATPLAGQELIGFTLQGHSDHAEVGDGEGFGGSFAATLTPWLMGRIDVDTRRGSNERFGRTCRDTSGVIGCATEELITSATRMDAFTIGLLAFWEPGLWMRLSGGGGLAVGQFRYETTTESGLEAAVVNPRSAHPGVGLSAELRLRPLRVLPLAFSIGVQRRILQLEGCADSTVLHAPFCGSERFDDIRLGASILLGGRPD